MKYPVTTMQAYCAATQQPFQDILRERRLALGYLERPGNMFHLYTHAAAWIAEVRDCRVFAWGSILTPSKNVIHDQLTNTKFQPNLAVQLAKYDEVPLAETVEEGVLLWGHENWGHWIWTYLMRLMLDVPKDLPLIIHDKVPVQFLPWARLLGFEKFLTVHEGAQVKRLIVPSIVAYRDCENNPCIFPQIVWALREKVLMEHGKLFPNGRRKKLYFTRAKARWRRVVNETELFDALQKKGFEMVEMEGLTLAEQIETIADAQSIVIPTGGASPITMFAPVDCRVIELNIPGLVGTFGSRCWAHVLGQEFVRLEGVKTENHGPNVIDFDYSIDVEKVLRSL
jgi:hypothetical protein